MKYLLLLLSLSLFAEDKALIPNVSETFLNYRITPADNKFVYSSRIKLYKNDGFSISAIYRYTIECDKETKAKNDISYVVNYNFSGF